MFLLFAYITLFIGEGRFPSVEVRKTNSQESEETVQRETFICISSDLKNEIIVEDAPELIENGTFHNKYISEVSPNERDDSNEERMPLHLFVYGVRNYHLAYFRMHADNIIILSSCR